MGGNKKTRGFFFNSTTPTRAHMGHQMRAFHLTSWAEAFRQICFAEHRAFFFHRRLRLHPRRCSGPPTILRLQSNYH